jgi:hypothetical protein
MLLEEDKVGKGVTNFVHKNVIVAIAWNMTFICKLRKIIDFVDEM